MQFSVDLISDLHVESWNNFDWEGQPTSPYCIVAGDVSRDRARLVETLWHLGEQYAGVFYIDGNDEHRHAVDDLGGSYADLAEDVKNIPNVVYLQSNVVIVNGIAILATNGWWTYDFDPKVDFDETVKWYREYVNSSESSAVAINGVAYHDAAYFANSVEKLQTQPDVRAIILVTHTLPAPWIVEHDLDLINTYRYNTMGNSYITSALDRDTENKIKAWCFGHYHKDFDQVKDGIRYVNNCRGRGDTPWSQAAYYPKRITINF